jgi:hypothetical protein
VSDFLLLHTAVGRHREEQAAEGRSRRSRMLRGDPLCRVRETAARGTVPESTIDVSFRSVERLRVAPPVQMWEY